MANYHHFHHHMDDRVIDVIILPEKQKPCDNVQGNAINAVWKDAQRDFVKYEIGKNESLVSH